MSNANEGGDGSTDDEASGRPEREREEVRDRAHEEKAMAGALRGRLGDLDDALDDRAYPTTTDELVDACGEYEIQTQQGTTTFEAVFASSDDQTFDSADDVRGRILGLIHR